MTVFYTGQSGVQPKWVYLISSTARSTLASEKADRKGKCKTYTTSTVQSATVGSGGGSSTSDGGSGGGNGVDTKQVSKKPKYVNILTKIGVTSDPQRRLAQHNRLLPCCCRPTKTGAPHWVYEVLLGPFVSGSNALAERWLKKKRGLPSKFKLGLALAWEQIQQHKTLAVAAINLEKGNVRKADPDLSCLIDKKPTGDSKTGSSACAGGSDDDGDEEDEPETGTAIDDEDEEEATGNMDDSGVDSGSSSSSEEHDD